MTANEQLSCVHVSFVTSAKTPETCRDMIVAGTHKGGGQMLHGFRRTAPSILPTLASCLAARSVCNLHENNCPTL
eukprot:365219-Chlamydomonas_euryale.AAC.37